MGQSTDGILAFGWDLGGPEEGWAEWFEDWAEANWDEFEDNEDAFYLKLIGFENPYPNPWDTAERDADGAITETWREANRDAMNRYHGAQREALTTMPLEFVHHCSRDYGMYILSAPGLNWTAHRGTSVSIPEDVLRGDMLQEAKDRLSRVVKLLGLEPPEDPELLLASLWC